VRQSLWGIWIPDLLACGPLRAIRSLLASLRDPQPERLPQVTQPVLAIAGERDPICPVAWVERFAALGHNGLCEVIPGAAHATNQSAPEALERIVVGEMRARDAAARGASDAEQQPR
jgi:pimeloyl-ACP methyl ester carboxylesterase